jgi:hypothetical protein
MGPRRVRFPNITIESKGSVWLIDEVNQQYMRMPKTEGPRAPGPWEEPEPGTALYDLEWHPMVEWDIIDGTLHLWHPSDNYEGGIAVVSAPDAEIIGGGTSTV